jgi:cbb3-type cytochrome oxidase cytochrome c subunit
MPAYPFLSERKLDYADIAHHWKTARRAFARQSPPR